MSQPRQTCLYDRHVRLGARMIEFGGWDLPVQYDGILVEHQRTRTAVSVFDTCHMGEFLVEGPGAPDFLSLLLTPDLRALPDGRCRYGFMLDERGGIRDDLIAYRFAAERWMLVVNAGTREGDFEWIKAHAPAAGVALADRSGHTGKIDVQGPESSAAVARLLGRDVSDLRRFGFTTLRAAGGEVIVSRTGYTGETGYELYAPPDVIVRLWDELSDAGVRPAGLGARDTLRLEAGLPLYGHELTRDLTPVEAGLDRYARKAEPYIGREAVEDRRQNGVDYRLAGFKVEGRQSARNGSRVLAGGEIVGWVTSGSFAPTLGCAIGMAYVRPRLAVPGTRLAVQTARKALEAEVVEKPFYRGPGFRVMG
jgi:aminomethyltransferase